MYGQQPSDQSANEAEIRKMVDSYVQAFNRHDAKALADIGRPTQSISIAPPVKRSSGVLPSPNSLRPVQGAPEVKREVNVESIQFISPNVAVEHGIRKFLAPNAEPEEIEYSAVDVKRDGKWLLDRVTDKTKEPSSHYEQLKPLEWMVGQWTKRRRRRGRVDCNWTKNKNFLTRAFKITVDGTPARGMQLIGWDPATKKFRSWTFDANGTFAEATWEQKGGRWFIRNRGTLPDGRTAP